MGALPSCFESDMGTIRANCATRGIQLHIELDDMMKEEDAMNFWELFITASMPVLKVLLITAVGAILALGCFDVLRDKERKLKYHRSHHLLVVFCLQHYVVRIYSCKSCDVKGVNKAEKDIQ
ncbi:hypothetical protein CR513_11884, partial [Mucuna pruriens]